MADAFFVVALAEAAIFFVVFGGVAAAVASAPLAVGKGEAAVDWVAEEALEAVAMVGFP